MAIFLCGFMGCGKTTVGKKLSELLSRDYRDMDQLISERAGMTIPEIFEKKGEAEFRRMESELICDLKSFDGIVSCGGGALLSDINGENARKSGIAVFLDVPFEICYGRIKDDPNRPLAASRTKEQLLELYNERYPKYKKNSGVRAECDGTPEKIASDIIYLLKNIGALT